jgi:capsular polysaccharide biosynthesis protein
MEMRHNGDVRGAAGVIMPRPAHQASPKPLRNGLIALVAGLAISSAALFAVRRGWFRLDWPG